MRKKKNEANIRPARTLLGNLLRTNEFSIGQ